MRRPARHPLRFRHAVFAILAGVLTFAPRLATAAESDSGAVASPRLVHPSMGTEVKRPSPGVAALLSHAGLVIPIVASTAIRDEHGATRSLKQSALVATGIVVGPAFGYWYGDVGSRSTRGLVGRTACAGVFFGTWAVADEYSSGDFDVATLGMFGVMCASAAVGGVWAIWDAANVGPRVNARNREVRAVSWGVGGAITSSSHVPALAITARF